MSKKYDGYEKPKENWFKIPNRFIVMSSEMNLAEMKVVLYILRHTWGYSEYEKPKRITMDEFMYGRKRKDGTRMDNGTGLGETTIRNGLKTAEENGHITVVVDDNTDKARIRKSYMFRTQKKNTFNLEVEGSENEGCGSDLDGYTSEAEPRSERVTLEESNLRERISSKKKKERSARVQEPTILSDDNEFDRKQAAMLRSVLIRYNADLVAPKPPRRPITLDTLRKSITRLRMERDVSKSQIENMLLWLEKHFDDQFTPSINKVDDFYNKWKSFVKVKNNWEIENGDTNVADYNTNTDASRVSTWLQENGWDPWNEGTPDQALVDQACRALKIKAGSISSSEITV